MDIQEDPPNLSDNDDGDESDDWDEMETGGEQTACLFCPELFCTIAVALDHCRIEHNFDLLSLKTKYNMDCYSYIKMINYIRMNKPTANSLMISDMPIWNDDRYLKPLAVETWLMYDFEDLGSTPSTPNNIVVKELRPNMTMGELQQIIIDLSNQLQDKDQMLDRAMADMQKMRITTQKLIENSGDHGRDDLKESCVATVPLEDDEGYFHTYSHYDIHFEMLSDRVRTESYRDAILNNKDLFEGKEVLDLGCGTGILSMFSATAGAKKVWAIDQSEIIHRAMIIISENNLTEKIHLVRGKLENGRVPFDKVDIIVSEWMGYFLLFEGMLDSVIYARKFHLAPGGIMLPNRCNISIVGSGDVDDYKKHIDFWKDIYGFSMKCMVNEVIREASTDIVPADQVITEPVVLTAIDLNTCDFKACDFSTNFNLSVLRDGQLTALVGYFDAFFDLPKPLSFSTGPHTTPTHWKQTIFYLKDPILVKQGEKIPGKFICNRHTTDVRSLKVIIIIKNRKYNYTLQ